MSPRSGTGAAVESVESLTFTGWVDRPATVEPPLMGDVTCDVVIVGGGLLGMTTALRLAELGTDVALVEGDFLGWGSASRNAGYLTNTVAGDPQMLAAAFPRLLRSLVEVADRAVDHTEGLLDRLAIDCEYQRSGNVLSAVSPGQVRRAQRNAAILQKAGADAEYVEARAFGLPHHVLGAVYEKRGGLLNPGLLARGLRDAVLASPVRVFEATPVGAIRREGAGVVVTAAGGRVLATKALIATNAFSRDLAITPQHLSSPLWVSMVETEPIARERIEATGWTNPVGMSTLHTVLENYRLTPRDTMIFGIRKPVLGRGALGPREPDAEVVRDQLRGFRERFPELADVRPARTWGGWIAMTPSWLPVAGEIDPHVVYAIPCNGHGLALAPFLGHHLARRLAGGPVPEEIAPVWRAKPRFLPSPVFTAPAVEAVWRLDRTADWWQRRRS